MQALPGKHMSIWHDSVTFPDYPTLTEPVSPDVVVIGGGIVGVTAAYALKKAGARVCLIENLRLGAGTTGRTTAKVTSLHGLVYGELAGSLGNEKAGLYGRANQDALAWMESVVAGESVDCDFLTLPAYTFTASDAELPAIQREAEVAKTLGLPAEYVDEIDLPVEVKGAVRFDHQAQFHPLKYLFALARTIPGDGSAIFEHTRALDVEDGHPCVVRTNRGDIRAKQVIVATHLPFLMGGLYYARTHPMSHPAIAYRTGASGHTELQAEAGVPGMYLGVGGSPHSVRTVKLGQHHYLISDTVGYKTGHEQRVSDIVRGLVNECEAAFPASTVEYRWEAHDYHPADGVPYVGRLTTLTRNVFVATGFRAWGMTNGTAAALMLTALLTGSAQEWMDVFDSTRKDAKQLSTMGKQVLETTRYLLVPRILKSHEKVGDMAAGDSKIAEVGGEQVAVARDTEGAWHAVKPTCRHFGCAVNWNDAEETWDCPCHGSRYLADGEMLNAPTAKDLEKAELPPM